MMRVKKRRSESRDTSETLGKDWLLSESERHRNLFDLGWVDSGDLFYIADGELFITGRTKRRDYFRGLQPHPQELKEAVSKVPGVRLGFVAVFGT